MDRMPPSLEPGQLENFDCSHTLTSEKHLFILSTEDRVVTCKLVRIQDERDAGVLFRPGNRGRHSDQRDPEMRLQCPVSGIRDPDDYYILIDR